MDQGAAAGVVEGHELAIEPGDGPGAVDAKTEPVALDPAESGQGDAAERDDDRRIDGRELGAEEGRAALQVGGAGAAIAAAAVDGVAEDGVGDEDLVAAEADVGEEGREAPAGLLGSSEGYA